MYAFHPHGALLVVTVLFPCSCGTNVDHKKSAGKRNCESHQKELFNAGPLIDSLLLQVLHSKGKNFIHPL
jgi:hypothetical protein